MLKTINKHNFFALAKKYKYYKTRWQYFEYVIKIIKSHEEWNSCLELGPYKLPIVFGSDLMDIKINNVKKLNYIHDAGNTPWPIEDKKYDLFIALQVWEHLSGNSKNKFIGAQQRAFEEVVRISKNAILSFPYRWKTASFDHRGINEKIISYWTNGIKPSKTKILVNKKNKIKKRIVYFWEFGG